jgi:mannose-6-phosphate isomerase
MRRNKSIIEKPWGHEEIWAQTAGYAGKILFIKKGHRLSRQYHKVKEETIMVQEGVLICEEGPATPEVGVIRHTMVPGDILTIYS